MCLLLRRNTACVQIKQLHCQNTQSCMTLWAENGKWAQSDQYLCKAFNLCHQEHFSSTFELLYFSQHPFLLMNNRKTRFFFFQMLTWPGVTNPLDEQWRVILHGSHCAQCSARCALSARSSANIQRPQVDPGGASQNEGFLLSTQDFLWGLWCIFLVEASALPSTNITLTLRATSAEWPNLSNQQGHQVLTIHKILEKVDVWEALWTAEQHFKGRWIPTNPL